MISTDNAVCCKQRNLFDNFLRNKKYYFKLIEIQTDFYS